MLISPLHKNVLDNSVKPSSLSKKKINRYFLSLGSNVRPEFHIPKALRLLRDHFSIIKKSSVYETSPFGPAGDDYFWNCVLQFESNQSLEKITEFFLFYEKRNGHDRNSKDKFAARTISLDFIPCENYQTLPFVVIPLAEIFPDQIDSQTKKSFKELSAQMGEQTKTYRRIPETLIDG